MHGENFTSFRCFLYRVAFLMAGSVYYPLITSAAIDFWLFSLVTSEQYRKKDWVLIDGCQGVLFSGVWTTFIFEKRMKFCNALPSFYNQSLACLLTKILNFSFIIYYTENKLPNREAVVRFIRSLLVSLRRFLLEIRWEWLSLCLRASPPIQPTIRGLFDLKPWIHTV